MTLIRGREYLPAFAMRLVPPGRKLTPKFDTDGNSAAVPLSADGFETRNYDRPSYARPHGSRRVRGKSRTNRSIEWHAGRSDFVIRHHVVLRSPSQGVALRLEGEPAPVRVLTIYMREVRPAVGLNDHAREPLDSRRHRLDRDVAVALSRRARGVPLDRIEDAGRDAGLHAYGLEAVPPPVHRCDVWVGHDLARELRQPVLEAS